MKNFKQIIFLISFMLLSFNIGCGTAPSPISSSNNSLPNEEQAPQDTPETINLPLRILLADFESSPDFNSQVDQNSLINLIADVNIIYAKIGIHWDLQIAEQFPLSSLAVPSVSDIDTEDKFFSTFFRVSPPAIPSTWTAIFMKTFPIQHGGLYVAPTQTVIFSEQVGPQKVLSAHILAHELGHSLGLPHTEEQNNLMAPGPTDINVIVINQLQIETIKAQVPLGPRLSPPRP